jgi:hypothetical protein
VEPCVETGEVHGRCDEDVLEVGFRLSKIAAAAQPEASNALRQSAFDPGATGIAFQKPTLLPTLRYNTRSGGPKKISYPAGRYNWWTT